MSKVIRQKRAIGAFSDRNRYVAALRCIAIVSFGAIADFSGMTNADAQLIRRAARPDVIIQGRVEGIYQSADATLVEIAVQRSETPDLNGINSERFPAPGELTYVLVSGRSTRLPAASSRIRASLRRSTDGRWNPAGPDWIGKIETDRNIASNEAETNRITFGAVTETERVGLESLLKVVRVVRGSAAESAGIEPGDRLVAAQGIRLQSSEQLDKIFEKSGGQFSLTVRDVRTGKDVAVQVKSGLETPTTRGPARPQSESLGIEGTLAFFEGESALKVIAVQPGSRADRAGIQPGLLILQADGREISSMKDFENASAANQGRMELQVVNPDDRIKRSVRF